MSSINFSGDLAEIKSKFYELAKENYTQSNEIFTSKNSSATYFIKYENSKHLDKTICEYSSSEIANYRDNLTKLWEDDDNAKKFIPVLLQAYQKTQEVSKNQLPDIDLYNYMM